MEGYYRLGLAYARKEMLDEAILQFQHALKIDSDMAVIYNSMGLIYYKRHNLKRAIESFQIAIDLNPQSTSAHVNLGRTYSSLRNLDGALDQYFMAIKIEPELGAAHYNIACIYSLRKQKGLAIEWLKKAVGSDKKFARMARVDKDFLNISNSLEFQHTVQLDN